jgi:hypothetical protein
MKNEGELGEPEVCFTLAENMQWIEIIVVASGLLLLTCRRASIHEQSLPVVYSEDFNDHTGGFRDIFGTGVYLTLFLECRLTFGRAKVDAGQLEAGEGGELVVKSPDKRLHGTVAGIYLSTGHASTENHSDCHDCTRDGTA